MWYPPKKAPIEGLITTLRESFSNYGIPETLTTDGGPEFSSHLTKEFLKRWNVHHRVASAYNPHANCRAEIGVKTIKRLIAGNLGPGGNLDADSFHRALLTYRNNPDPGTKQSPAMYMFGRPTRDLVPRLPSDQRPRPTSGPQS